VIVEVQQHWMLYGPDMPIYS